MRYLPPVPWRLIAPGTIVLIGGVPRVVHVVRGDVHGVTVFAEGIAPYRLPDPQPYAQPVLLDDTDAIGNLLRAGLTLTPIKE
jgi:hypothetical protein